MSVRRSAGSIFWGLTLMAIGGLLLVRNLGYPIPIWSGIAVYWPILLIVWGLLKVFDYYHDRRAGQHRPLFSGGEVALLILVIIAGSAVTTAANLDPGFGRIFNIGDLDLWDITGNNFEYTEHKEADVPAGSTIEIVNMYGGIEVRPSDGDRVILDVRKTVRAANKEEADRASNEFTFSILNEGSKYRIVSNRDESGGSRFGRRRQSYKSSLSIQVPKQSMLLVENRNGKISVEGLTGTQKITNRYGDVEVHSIIGAVELQNRNGGVNVGDITESAAITNGYGAVTARNVGGAIDIRNRNGSVDVSGVKGDVRVENSYAPITVTNVEGKLTISGRNNSVEVDHVEGSVTAESSYQNVRIQDVKGAITVRNRNGDIRLGFPAAPQENISVTAQYSDVTVELPPEASFSLDARTEFGSVYSEFDELGAGSSGQEKSLNGRRGQGSPQIHIDTKNGDIRIEKRG